MGFFSSKRHGIYKNVDGKAVLVEEEVYSSGAAVKEPTKEDSEPKVRLDYVLRDGKVMPREEPSENATGAELLKDMLNTFSFTVKEESAQEAKKALTNVFEKLEPAETVREVFTALEELDAKTKKTTTTKKTQKKKVAPKKRKT